MKKLFFTLTLSFFATFIFAQTDIVWGIGTGSSNQLKKFSNVGANTGSTFSSPTSFDTDYGSAALGISQDGGYLYYIPYGNNAGGEGNGVLDIRSIKNNGSSDDRKINDFDMNGSGNDNGLGFVRLGIDRQNVGWIIAGESNASTLAIYLGKFQASNTGTATGAAALGKISITGITGLVPGDFSNGDLCLDGVGNLYVLANNGANATRIFQIKKADLNTAVSANSLSHTTPMKFIALAEKTDGTGLEGNANGLAFSSTGNLYLSTNNKIYFITASSFNTHTGIVNFAEVANNDWGLADLATNFDVQTPLPTIFGNNISATSKNGQLSVQWQSLNEVNSTGYTVEASKDGNNWVPIGTVQSLASNGNSSGTLDYSFSTSTLPISLAGLSIAFLLGAIFKSRIVRLIIAVVVVGTVFSCSKNMNEQVNANKFDNLYIRVSGKDINQHTNYSKVVKVQNL